MESDIKTCKAYEAFLFSGGILYYVVLITAARALHIYAAIICIAQNECVICSESTKVQHFG